MRKKLDEKKVCFGDIATYILWKLTGGESYATDYSFASTTGVYDPFMVRGAAHLYFKLVHM